MYARVSQKTALYHSYGLILLAFAELWFVSTGVETFNRSVTFGGVPIWLPVLWAYAFVMMRREILALDEFVK